MSRQAIVSLAMLKVNWDLLGKTYLDNFVPFVAECLRLSSDEVVSLPKLKTQIKDLFGLDIPQNSVHLILKRACKQGYISLEPEEKVYRPNREKLEGLNFDENQQKVLRMHDSLIDALIKFCSEKYRVHWSKEQAETALLCCLREDEVLVLNAATTGTLIPEISSTVKSSKYLVAQFISHLQQEDSPLLGDLETIVKGNMLANALFLPDPNQAQKKFRNNEIYLDTTFLIYALGWAGEPRKEPCVELVRLLYETGAELRCFRHTVDEIKGILGGNSSAHESVRLEDRSGARAECFQH